MICNRVCSSHGPDRSRGSQIVTGSKILTVVMTMVPYIGFLAFKMSQIEAKSINFRLRYDQNWNISSNMHQFELIFQFGSYLSQKLMDFASIWLIFNAKNLYMEPWS